MQHCANVARQHGVAARSRLILRQDAREHDFLAGPPREPVLQSGLRQPASELRGRHVPRQSELGELPSATAAGFEWATLRRAPDGLSGIPRALLRSKSPGQTFTGRYAAPAPRRLPARLASCRRLPCSDLSFIAPPDFRTVQAGGVPICRLRRRWRNVERHEPKPGSKCRSTKVAASV